MADRPTCPSCGTELRIGTTYNTIEDGKPCTIQQLVCANKKCAYNKAKAPVKIVKHKLNTGTQDSSLHLCCDGLIAKITDTAFFVPETVTHTIENGELRAVCPTCGKKHIFDVAEKKQIS